MLLISIPAVEVMVAVDNLQNIWSISVQLLERELRGLYLETFVSSRRNEIVKHA